MNLQKLTLLFFLSFCAQVKADIKNNSNENNYSSFIFDSCSDIIEDKKDFFFSKCIENKQNLLDFLNLLVLFQVHPELSEAVPSDSSYLSGIKTEVKPDPICPIPLPQFNDWISNYKLLCFQEEDSFESQNIEKAKPDPICPIPLPQFNNGTGSDTKICLQESDQKLQEKIELDTSPTYYTSPPYIDKFKYPYYTPHINKP